MKIAYIGILVLISLLMSSYLKPNSDDSVIFDFTPDVKVSDWNVLNDGVMGGVSSSSFVLNEEGNGVFEGEVSTANNGGFASVRYSSSSINVSESKTVKIRLKGDGKDYQFRVKRSASDAESYIITFETTGDWQTIDIELSSLYPSFRGRKLNMPNFNFDSIEELSFLISNMKNELFRLELDKIELE